MVQKENSKKKIDDLALKLFEQIGLKEDEIESTIDFANLIENIPKPTHATEFIPKPAKDISDALRIEQLEKLVEEQHKKIIKYETFVSPKLILMIKNYMDKLKSAENEIQIKQNKIIELEKQLSHLKGIIKQLKSIWLEPGA